MLSESQVTELLSPFALALTSGQIGRLLTYLELLLRWNRKVNLTAIRSPQECVTRHFGESLYLSHWSELRGKLLDIGSGAGFPGLALRIAFPALAVTLLEPVAKKRAFLKEVARACQMESVVTCGERLEQFLQRQPLPCFDVVTARAVGQLDTLVPLAAECLAVGGHLCLWVSHDQAVDLIRARAPLVWASPMPLPLSRRREIWVGTRVHSGQLA